MILANTAEDPGWFADWDFVENGQNICAPDSAVLRDARGVLRDDDPVNVQYQSTAATNGYMDNADCGVRIRGPSGAPGRGSTINFHLVQMNLETGGACAPGGCDFLDIYVSS